MTLGPGDYSIQTTAFWSERVYSHVFRFLNEYNVQVRSSNDSHGCIGGTSPQQHL